MAIESVAKEENKPKQLICSINFGFKKYSHFL